MRKAALGMFVLLFLVAVIVLALAMTPADSYIKRSDVNVLRMAIINSTVPSYLGMSITSADFNNDSITDLAIGGPTANLSGGAADFTGQVYVFYGSHNGFSSGTVASANVTLNGTSPGYFGVYLHAADMNNDSRPDLIASAPFKNLNGGAYDSTGQVYVFYGSAEGLHSSNTSQANITFNGTTASGLGGSSLPYYEAFLVDDFNNDRITDIVMRANRVNVSGGVADQTGQVYIFYGSSDGFHSAYSAADANVTLNGTSPGGFGLSLAKGDFNNDGYLDIAVGAPTINLSGGARDNTGQVYVFYGSANGFHSYTAGQANVTFNGTYANDYVGQNLLADDFNADNVTDLAIAAIGKNLSGGAADQTGQVYIFYGRTGGWQSSILPVGANVTLNGTGAGQFGFSIDYEDINNDNRKDLIVGANKLDSGSGNFQGQASLFYGTSEGIKPRSSLEANITINGTYANEGIGYTITVGDYNNDGIKELALSAPYVNITLPGDGLGYYGQLQIFALNFIPNLSSAIPNPSWNEDSSITINLSAYFTDVNRDELNYTWVGNTNIALSIDESTNVATLTPNANWHGTEYIMFYANDSYNDLVASNNITLTVSNTADCGDNTCDASESCTSCAADCGACPAVAGGSIISAPTAAFTVGILPADMPTKFNLGERTAVSMITVTSNTNLNNVRIEAKEVQEASVKEPLETAYKYLEISTRNIKYEEIKDSKITFKVDKKWVEEKGIEKSQIILMRYSNGWQKLETSYFGTSNGDYAYQALSPGFSTFAIASLPKEEVKESEEAEKPVAEPETEEPIVTPPTSEPKGYGAVYIIAAVAILSALIFYLKKRKKL